VEPSGSWHHPGAMNEAKLIEKLRLIEALFAGSDAPGERAAADHARQRILERLATLEREAPPIEYRFSMTDLWARRVFVALLRRYGLRPYRYKRQRYTTVMVRVSERFVDETLWPQFQQLSEALRAHLSEVTDRVVSQVLSDDLSEAAVVEPQQSLPAAAAPAVTPPAVTPPAVTPPAAAPAVTPPAAAPAPAQPAPPASSPPAPPAAASPSSKNAGKRKRRKRRRR